MKHLLNSSKRWLGLLALSMLLVLASLITRTTAAQPGINTVVIGGSETTSVVVSPEAGGELVSPDGQVTITFPPEMFTETTVVTYTETVITALPPNLVHIGPSFTLQAARVSDGQPVVLFEMGACPGVRGEPSSKSECGDLPGGGMEITVNYTEGNIDRTGVAEEAFTLRYFYSLDGISGKWLSLPTLINTEHNFATASTWYFTHFALMGLSQQVSRISALSQVEVIVDDRDSGFVRFYAPDCDECAGYWWDYWSSLGTYAGHSYYTKNSNDAHGRENWGEWTPYIPQSGQYEIFAFIPDNHATTPNAYYRIYRYGSQVGTITVNQLNIYAQWVSLGTYYLPQGSHSKVYLDDMTGNQNYAQEEIGFDAVKFVCRDCGPGPTSTPGPTTTPWPTSTPRPTYTPPPPIPTPTKPAPAVIGRADWNCPTDELEAPYTTPVAQEPTMVVIHHTTSRNDPTQETTDSNDKYDWATFSDAAPDWLPFGRIPRGTVATCYDPIKDTWAGEVLMTWLVERYKNGWTDMAYHYLIDGNGNVYQGSYYGIGFEKGATCSEISRMIQVALLGCFEPDACEREGGAVTPFSAAIDSLEALIEWLGCNETQFLLPDGGTENNIKGHRDIDNGSNPSCPTTDCPGENLYSLLPEIRRRSNCGLSSRQVQFVGLEPWSQSTSAPSEAESVPEYYITVMGHEGAEIYVIDPEGRRLGIAPLSGGIVNEIPGADFQDNPMWGYEASRGDPIAEPAELVIAHIPFPVEGLYRVQIHGTLGALGGGLSLSARHGGDLKAMRMVIIEPGQQLPTEYQFIYSLDNEELVTNLFQDVTTPTTTHRFLATEGNNGWFVSDVTVVLEAMDDLSGVDFTTYRLDSGDWVTYTEPIVVSEEGTHALQYRSTDRVGNQENERSIAVNLDKTPPVVTITQPSVIAYTLGSTFTVKYEAYDAISGLDVITATLDGEVIANGQMFDTLFMLPGPHEIVVMAQDLAGWQTTQNRTLIVQVTIEGLVNAKHRLYDMGWIYGPGARGIVNSLDAKLEAAIRARDRGQLHTATNIINAFVHEVEAQTGKHITLEAAAILIRSAQYVTNQLVQQIPVSPGFGGSLFSPDEVIRVDFPPSAVTELAIATYRLVTETQSLMTTRSPVGRTFELDAIWYGSGEPVGNFLRPVTIVVGYNESDLGRADEARLALHYWDGEKWIEVSTTVEIEQNRALATVNHFTTYALMERGHKIYLPLVLAVVFLSGVTPFVPQVITRSRYLTARSDNIAGTNSTGSIKIIALVTLSTAIGVCMAGCKTSNEGGAFATDLGRATSESLSQETVSGCHITIMGHEGVEIYITDPVGRHLGVDPLSKEMVNEIPGGDFQDNPTWGYESSRGDSTAEPAKLVIAHIPDPVEGLYLVRVHGTLGALGGGLGLSARCSGEVKAMRMVNIEPGQELPLEYQFTYSLENEELVTELLLK